MAPNKPPACNAGEAQSPSGPKSKSTEARLCSCSVPLWSVLSLNTGKCAVCRSVEREALTTVELLKLKEQLQLDAARYRNNGHHDAAVDVEAEAQLVAALVHRRELGRVEALVRSHLEGSSDA